MEISTAKTNRIEVVDSLRGFAIMAILLVRMLFSPCFLGLRFISSTTIRRKKEKISDTVFCGA